MAAQQTADEAQETAGQAKGASGQAQDAAENGGEGLVSELKDVARDAALSVLKPAVRSAAQSAANYAVNKGPDMVKDRVGSTLGDGGGLGDLADKALSNAGPVGKVASSLGMGGKLVGGLTGGDEDGEGQPAEAEAVGSGRRMPVQQSMDVAVPLETAYNQWTQFEEYPNFMHRVDSASQDDETHVTFTEKVWGFGRDFEAEILEQRPNERIVWRSVNGLKHAGVVTFHELAPRLTRIEVTVDFKPESLFQKFARGARYSKRAIRADMHRFKAYIEMKEEEDGAWLGRIEDGEVVGYEEPDEEQEGAEAEDQEQEGAEDEQPEGRAEGEDSEDQAEGEEESGPEAADQDEPEQEEPDEAEEEQRPRRRRPQAQERGDGRQRRRPAAGAGRSRQRPSPKRPQRRQPARA